jgi:hypothetical protein
MANVFVQFSLTIVGLGEGPRFDDCLRLGKRIDERPYKLPNPEITRISSTDPVQLPPDSHLKGASSAQPGGLPTPRSQSPVRADLNVFRGKKVMLSDDLDLGSRLRGTIEDMIASGGGAVTGSVHKADLFICHWREGREYRIASRAGKDVGNLSWLYYLIAHNAWTSPLRRLLHYPLARGGVPGFARYCISLSSYGGETRWYLENLVVAAGATYTGTLRPGNTHLVTARPHSEKVDAARAWNIHMVNHLWLEESYARWEEQSLTNPRYTHFPPRTHLGEVVGQTQIDRHMIESIFFPPNDDDEDDDDEDGGDGGAGLSARTPATVRRKDEKVHAAAASASAAAPLPTRAAPAPPPPPPPAGSPRRPPAKALPSKAVPAPPKPREQPQQQRPKDARTPTAARFGLGGDDGRDVDTPSTTGSRSAKNRAVARLHELAPDIALYEKERRRVGGVVRGGRRLDARESDGLGHDHDHHHHDGRVAGAAGVRAGVKRSISRQAEDDGGGGGASDTGETEARDAKRAKKASTKPPPVSMRLLITGYQGWVERAKAEEDDKVCPVRRFPFLSPPSHFFRS